LLFFLLYRGKIHAQKFLVLREIMFYSPKSGAVHPSNMPVALSSSNAFSGSNANAAEGSPLC
jgi:hypothetical protein